jgi:hypothetical protein
MQSTAATIVEPPVASRSSHLETLFKPPGSVSARGAHLPGAEVWVGVSVVPHQGAVLDLNEGAVRALGVRLHDGQRGLLPREVTHVSTVARGHLRGGQTEGPKLFGLESADLARLCRSLAFGELDRGTTS